MSEILELFRESTPHKILFLMLLITVAVTVVAKFLEMKFKKDEKMDIEKIFEASRCLNCSEYDIFCKTGKAWNVSEASVKEDFKRYLLSGELPHYVRHYLRSPGGTKPPKNTWRRKHPGGFPLVFLFPGNFRKAFQAFFRRARAQGLLELLHGIFRATGLQQEQSRVGAVVWVFRVEPQGHSHRPSGLGKPYRLRAQGKGIAIPALTGFGIRFVCHLKEPGFLGRFRWMRFSGSCSS